MIAVGNEVLSILLPSHLSDHTCSHYYFIVHLRCIHNYIIQAAVWCYLTGLCFSVGYLIFALLVTTYTKSVYADIC